MIMMDAKGFYKTMWNDGYIDTEHPQFSYKEMIEFAEEYNTMKVESTLATVMRSDFKNDAEIGEYLKKMHKGI